MDNNQVHIIALKTLKQRCEYLQERLKAVEEENCKLKLEVSRDYNKKISKDSNGLEERIIILNKEKSQITHQIQMIAKENITLWSYLSKVLPGSNIPSLKFSVSAETDNTELKFNPYENISEECNKESLEEISLKLINGIIMGKNELEKQYFQMIDLHKDNIIEENSSFLPKQVDNRLAIKNIKEYVQKLKDFKETLYQQKKELSNAISIIKNSKVFSKEYVSANQKNVPSSHNKESDVSNDIDFEFLTLQDLERTTNRDEKLDSDKKVCPMCGKTFTGAFKNFFEHVTSHFNSEVDEFVDARGSFDDIQ